MSLKEEILSLVDSSEAGVTYSQLMDLEGLRGDCALTNREHPNVCYWKGLSRPAAEAILELKNEGRIRQEPTDTLAYIAQGLTLELPVFTAELLPVASSLDQPHWMPVLLISEN